MADKQLRVVFSVNEADLKRFNDLLKQSGINADKLDDSLKDIDKTSGSAFDTAGKGVNQLVTGVKAFLALGLVNELKNIAIEASKVAAAGEGIRSAYSNLGGTTSQLEAMSEAVGGTVDKVTLLRLGVQSLQKGVGLESLSKVLSYVNKQAGATGQSLEGLASVAINSIGKESVKGLNQLGLSMKNVEKRADQIGFMPALLEDIAEKTKKMGDLANPTADAYDRLAASQTNLKEAFGRLLNSNEFNGVQNFMSRVVDSWTAAFDDLAGNTPGKFAELTSQATDVGLAAALESTKWQILTAQSQLAISVADQKAKDEKVEYYREKQVAIENEISLRTAATQAGIDAEEKLKNEKTQEQADAEIARRKIINEKVNEYLKTEAKEASEKELQDILDNLVDPSQMDSTGSLKIDNKFLDMVSEQTAKFEPILGEAETGMSETTEKVKTDFDDMLDATMQIVGLFNGLGKEDSGAMSFFSKFFKAIMPLLSIAVPGAGAAFGVFSNLLNLNSGGQVGKPIGPNADTVLAGLTLGEYVVKRESTKRSALLLDAINSGELDDKMFLRLQQSPVIVNVDQDKVVQAIQSMPQTDFYKSGSALYEVKKVANEKRISRKQRISL